MHPPPSPAKTNFTLITECTPESSGCSSVYSVGKTVQHTNIRDLVEFKYVGGLKKEFKTGGIKLPMSLSCCAVNVGGNYGINSLKITKWGHFKDSKWSLAQNLDFSRGPRLF